MPLLKNDLFRIIFALGVMAMLLLGFFGMAYLSMGMNADGTMVDCPFGDGMSICTMSPMAMLTVAQNMLLGLPVRDNAFSGFSILLFATLAFILFYLSRSLYPPLQLLLQKGSFSNDQYIPQHSLQVAYSRGALNPKLF